MKLDKRCFVPEGQCFIWNRQEIELHFQDSVFRDGWMVSLLVQAAHPGWINTNSGMCCLRNHWCNWWRRLSAWVTFKGQCELDVTHIQRWEFISVGSFFFFSLPTSPPAWVTYCIQISIPSVLMRHKLFLPPPPKKNHFPCCVISLRTLISSHRCTGSPVENVFACVMRRCYGWGIDKYWKEDDLLSWQPRKHIRVLHHTHSQGRAHRPQRNADEPRCSPPCCTLQ